jgi:iron complex outermembrane receptor protein
MNGDNMVDITPVTPLEFQFNNNLTANTEGVEVAVDWQASESWRLKGTYSWFHLEITRGNKDTENSTPQNMFSINSFKNFSQELELNTNIFFQDRINKGTSDDIASWIRFDLGLVWHMNNDIEFGIWGQNLLDSKHQEFTPGRFINSGASEIPRSIFFQMKYHF